MTTGNLPNNLTEEEMVKLVNEDLLPFFDENESLNFKFSVEYKVTKLLGEQGKDYMFLRADGNQLGVWKDYFYDPETWKENRLKKFQGIVY